MPNWKLRSPDSFAPVLAQAAIRSKAEGVSIEIPLDFKSRAAAKQFQKSIHFWRFCLRESKGHPLHPLETDNRITSKIVETGPDVFRVAIEVKRNLYDYIAGV